MFDGFIETRAIMGTFCGSSLPPAMTSVYNVIYAQFKTDDSWTFGGFNASYNMTYGWYYYSIYVGQV